MDEQRWVRQAQEGDLEAFGHLVRLYQTPIYNLAYRMLGETMDAEDATQETFLRAFQYLHRYDPARPFRTWLLSIAAHYCVDILRRRRPQVTLNDEIAQNSPSPSPTDAVAAWEQREHIQQMLMRLSPDDRAVITLMYWYDFSCEEIAGILGTTVSAVKSRLYRARLALAEMLKDQDAEER
ncbi:MAG: sigma-70 family RNA polymerase sigma factor [Anaerolineae bacterium]|nr:sigma-70 family RNA polymerase sigma factor [Anaerolineae bacterium]